MISIIPGYRNRNLLVKWINSHQHHTCVYMGTVLLPFWYIIEQSTNSKLSESIEPYTCILVLTVEYPEVRHMRILFPNTVLK
jgi:hypothetical protein